MTMSVPIKRFKVSVLIENILFRIPQEKWYIYPAWLFLYIQTIVVPVIILSAIASKIFMKKEIKRYIFCKSIHQILLNK